jgi:hypothetical protein
VQKVIDQVDTEEEVSNYLKLLDPYIFYPKTTKHNKIKKKKENAVDLNDDLMDYIMDTTIEGDATSEDEVKFVKNNTTQQREYIHSLTENICICFTHWDGFRHEIERLYSNVVYDTDLKTEIRKLVLEHVDKTFRPFTLMRKVPIEYYHSTVNPDGLCWYRMLYIMYNYYKNNKRGSNLSDVDMSNIDERNKFVKTISAIIDELKLNNIFDEDITKLHTKWARARSMIEQNYDVDSECKTKFSYDQTVWSDDFTFGFVCSKLNMDLVMYKNYDYEHKRVMKWTERCKKKNRYR